MGYSPWSHEESDTTERLHFHFSLWCIGEGNGTPLQCSCLENSRDGGAWWAAIYEVAQNRTLLKRFSSSSSCRSLNAIHLCCHAHSSTYNGFSVKLLKLSLPLFHMCMWSHFSHIWLCETLWMVAHQVPLSMELGKNTRVGSMPSSKGSSWPRDQIHVSCLLHWQVGSLPLAPPGESLPQSLSLKNKIIDSTYLKGV